MKRNVNAGDPWWRHQMEIFCALLSLRHKSQWRGALMFSLICGLNKRFSKQSLGWWFGKPSRSLWLHCNAFMGTGMPAPNWLHMFTTYDLFPAIPYIKFHGRTNSHIHTSILRHYFPCAEFSKNMFVLPVLWGDLWILSRCAHSCIDWSVTGDTFKLRLRQNK